MERFVIEVYTPHASAHDASTLAARARTVVDALRMDGRTVRYVRSVWLAKEETFFHFLDAASTVVAAEAGKQLGALTGGSVLFVHLAQETKAEDAAAVPGSRRRNDEAIS